MEEKDIRKYFSDFRYLPSTNKPDVIKEYVRYDELINLIKTICG